MLEYIRAFLDDGSVALVDGDSDFLWDDTLIVRFLNEGMRLLARGAWCIIETGVAPAGQIVLATGVSIYPLHKSILYVWDATPSTQTMPLGKGDDIELRDVNLLTNRTDDAFDALEIGMEAALAGGNTSLSGAPLAFAPDAGFRKMRVFPPPTATQNGLVVNLKVARLPITWLTLDNISAEPETPDDYTLSLCDYAAGRCLLQPNVDSQQKTTGRELVTAFNDMVKDARRDRQRMFMTPSRWNFSSATAVLR